MGWSVVTPPAVEPVSIVEAKAHLRVEEALDDAFIEDLLIPAARGYVEKACSRALIEQTIKTFHAPPCGREAVTLLGGSLATVPALAGTYIDPDGAEQTLSGLIAVQRGDAQCARVIPAVGSTWPAMACRDDALRLQYVVGWADADAVPVPLRQAVLLMISQLYEHRTPEVTGTISTTLALSLEALMAPYRLFTI